MPNYSNYPDPVEKALEDVSQEFMSVAEAKTPEALTEAALDAISRYNGSIPDDLVHNFLQAVDVGVMNNGYGAGVQDGVYSVIGNRDGGLAGQIAAFSMADRAKSDRARKAWQEEAGSKHPAEPIHVPF